MKGQPMSFDERNGKQERDLNDIPVDWISFRGEDQTIVQTLVFGP